MKTSYFQMNVKPVLVPGDEPDTFKNEDVPPVFTSLTTKDRVNVMSGGLFEEQPADGLHKKMARAVQLQVQSGSPPKILNGIDLTGEMLPVGVDNDALKSALASGRVLSLL